MNPPTLVVIFSSRQDLETQLGHLERGTVFVPVPEPEPQALSRPPVVLLAGEHQATFVGRVLQVVPNVGVALECADANIKGWVQQTSASLPMEGAAARSQWGMPADEDDDDDNEDRRASIGERIRGLTTNDKYKLALNGTKLERTLLLKDPNKTIQAHIIKNRRITLDEVRYLAGFRQANPDVLKQIAEHREWTQNPRIVSALVGNPKTPATIARKLLAKLPITEVRRLAKSPNTPAAVAAAAKKMVAGGG